MKNIVTGTLVAVVLSSLAVVYSLSSPSIHFVIPKGYSGLFVVYKDNGKGQDAAPEKGELKLYLNSDGTIYIKDVEVFNNWHRTAASFSDGTKIPIYNENPDASVALWGLNSIADGGMYYFVGSKDEYEKVSREFDITKLPLGHQKQEKGTEQ